MKVFLIAIIIAAALMIIAYFIYFFNRTATFRKLYSISLLILIALLIVSWIYSIAIHQHAVILLILAIIFIILHRVM